jgi:excisionase family DNA binding protein
MSADCVPPAATPKKFWSIEELAHLTGLSRQLWYKLISAGRVKGTRFPGARRVVVADAEVQRYLGEAQAAA